MQLNYIPNETDEALQKRYDLAAAAHADQIAHPEKYPEDPDYLDN